jgi:hypothetical protein
MLSRTITTTTYEPQQTAMWEAEYQRFKSIIEIDQE